MITPHGGKLVECLVSEANVDAAKTDIEVSLTERLVYDALMIAMGGFSPLEGFMGEADYRSVVTNMRLASGTLFAVPIVLPVDEKTYAAAESDQTVALKDPDGKRIGILRVSGKFMRDLELESEQVYRTTDTAHPGVAKIHEEGPYALGGAIELALPRIGIEFPDNFLTPAQTREYFEKLGYESIAAFQTRNPIHRAHEYLTKVALEMVDAVMIHPIVGEVKADDIPAAVRMECYATLIEKYYNPQRTLLNVLPMAMRYAGPREAIHHAIVRQNYGMTHLIIGRDHAGVGNYYGTYDAQTIFDQLEEGDLKITPLKFEHAFFCNLCRQMVTAKTCPHDKSNHVFLSGTKVREKLRNGEILPEEFTRPEISVILQKWM